MRIIKFQGKEGPRAGVIGEDDSVLDLGPAESLSLERVMAGEVPKGVPGPGLNDIELLPPLFGGQRVFAVGRNYRAHAEELGGKVPDWPKFFIRTPQSLVGHDSLLDYPHGFATYDYEGELAVVIGLSGRDIPVGESLAHVLGYTCFMDGSVREIQAHSLVAGKNFDRSGAIGPWIKLARDLPPDPTFGLHTAISGVIRQEASSAEMVYSVADLVHSLSLVTKLLPGDVIATGTPSRVGISFDPPRFLQPGDEVVVKIDGVGALRNVVGGTH